MAIGSLAPIFVAGTLQDSGKTSLSLGLMQAFIDRGLDPGYTKPVGQRYVMHFGQSIDKDAYLFHQVFDLPDRRKMMSPIAVRAGFTREFIRNPDVGRLEAKIHRCTDRLVHRHRTLIVEGTGHAGVGSCFGLSNARVAQLLGGRVVVVAAGGIGKPIDEVALNLSLFRERNVPVLGVVLNKVQMKKYAEVTDTVARGLELIGTRLLGAIPYMPALTHYTVGQVAEEFDYPVLFGRKRLMNRVETTVVLAMRPEHSAKHIRMNSMVVTPIDRPDSIETAVRVLKTYAPSTAASSSPVAPTPTAMSDGFLPKLTYRCWPPMTTRSR